MARNVGVQGYGRMATSSAVPSDHTQIAGTRKQNTAKGVATVLVLEKSNTLFRCTLVLSRLRVQEIKFDLLEKSGNTVQSLSTIIGQNKPRKQSRCSGSVWPHAARAAFPYALH